MAGIRVPPRTTSSSGRSTRSEVDHIQYARSMMARFTEEHLRRRAAEVASIIDFSARSGASSGPQVPPLKVELLEFYAGDNARAHHTDHYELVQDLPATPIFRRGQPFYLAMRFQDRAVNFDQDIIKFVFSFGHTSSITKGTKVILPITGRSIFGDEKGKWDTRVTQHDGSTLSLQIQIPATGQVGIWKCEIETSHKSNTDQVEKHVCKENIYVLFNPFCEDDLVYLEDPAQREEYVINDSGKVWIGSYRNITSQRWAFGQFDDVVLPCVMYLLEMSRLNHTQRGNPVKVVRALSATVNSSDDDGLLQGRWDGDYKDGTAPFMWTGSVKILEQYLKSGGQPVKYGQCWVFSAVTVTLCRALGIPCRSVTNFVSAHDTNHSLTVDKYFDIFGEEIPGGPDGECYDSMWNFHVWNDVWMGRPDLPKGYGGWQAIDATPQEESEAQMQCGPASVEAVRKGEIGFLYDTPFVFSEVNADVCHFKEDPESDWGFCRTKTNEYHVGRKVVTKSAYKDDDDGNDDIEDITGFYKNQEGSTAERMAVLNAVRGCDRAKQYYNYPAGHEDVTFDLVEIDAIPYGQPFKVTVNLQNTSDKVRSVEAILTSSSVYYTGVTANQLKKAQSNFVVQPKQRETLEIIVKPNEYMDKLVDYSMIKIYAMCSVSETKQTWSEEDDFVLEKPKLNIEIITKPKAKNPCQVQFSFVNPLHIALTECSFSFEGPGLTRPIIISFRDVNPGETVVHTETFVPRRTGQRKIVGTFNSRQMQQVTGSKTMIIEE